MSAGPSDAPEVDAGPRGPFQHVSIDEKKALLASFIAQTSGDGIARLCCGVCGELCAARTVSTHLYDGDLQSGFEKLLNALDFGHYEHDAVGEFDGLFLCENGVVPSGSGDGRAAVQVCASCRVLLAKGEAPPLSLARLPVGMRPPELSGLTIPEEMLIARVRVKAYIIRLRAIGDPTTRQRGLRGHCVCFRQDVAVNVTRLPASLDSLVDVIKVIFVGAGKPTDAQLRKVLQVLLIPARVSCSLCMWCLCAQVRRQKVRDALMFLMDNAPGYANLLLDPAMLEAIPVDAVPDALWLSMGFVPSDTTQDEHERSGYGPGAQSRVFVRDVTYRSC